MRVAIIGSRELDIDIKQFIPEGVTMIVSGGARGIDTLAERYADANNIPKRIFKPDYQKYGKTAPLERNKLIVDFADMVIAIWDGKSGGTGFVIGYASRMGKTVKIYKITGSQLKMY